MNGKKKRKKTKRIFNKSETKYIYRKIDFRIEKYISEIYLKTHMKIYNRENEGYRGMEIINCAW